MLVTWPALRLALLSQLLQARSLAPTRPCSGLPMVRGPPSPSARPAAWIQASQGTQSPGPAAGDSAFVPPVRRILQRGRVPGQREDPASGAIHLHTAEGPENIQRGHRGLQRQPGPGARALTEAERPLQSWWGAGGERSPGSQRGLSAAAEPAGAQPDLPPPGDLAASPVLAEAVSPVPVCRVPPSHPQEGQHPINCLGCRFWRCLRGAGPRGLSRGSRAPLCVARQGDSTEGWVLLLCLSLRACAHPPLWQGRVSSLEPRPSLQGVCQGGLQA